MTRLILIWQGEWEGLRPTRLPVSTIDPQRRGGSSPRTVNRVGLVLIVSHGLVLATLLCRAWGAPLAQARDLIQANTRPDEIEWNP